jgi:transcriptional regulator GlxA family with amidase domain
MSDRNRLDTIDELLLRTIDKSAFKSDLIDFCVQQIELQAGLVRIDLMAKHAGLSVRQLERRFMAAIGLSPKTYCGIVRFKHACARARDQAWTGWTKVAADCGYFDQAHLINDFHAFSGLPPRQFIQELTPLNGAILQFDEI